VQLTDELGVLGLPMIFPCSLMASQTGFSLDAGVSSMGMASSLWT